MSIFDKTAGREHKVLGEDQKSPQNAKS